ncbi:MAG: MerR family transcriptional regulator [Rikenellaceae bacterium]
MESKKLFYTMGEVTEMFDVSSSLIRYWEKHFNIIKPVRNKKGNRLFTPKDVENFKLIYHLVKERGMTLEGAKKSIRGGKLPANKEVELMDRLLNMRALLLEVREVLKEEDSQEPVREERAEVEKRVEVSAEKELFAFYEQNLF